MTHPQVRRCLETIISTQRAPAHEDERDTPIDATELASVSGRSSRESQDAAAAEWAACAPLLAGALRVRLASRRASGIQYRDRDERALTAVLPSTPAAVRVYGDDGTCRALCFDLDSSRGGAARVMADASRLVRELESAGARVITDVSPNGGRHVYVPLAERLDYTSARELVEAIATAYPTMDPGPHQSLRTGCIRVPGAAHASGGHQALTMSLNIAVDVLHRPSPREVVAALQEAYRAQIGALRATQAPLRAAEPSTEPHSSAARGRAISARLTRIARDGVYDTDRYASPSEARQAVIAGAVAAGWRLADVAARLSDGRWPGLAALYARYSPTQRHGALARDWHNAQRLVAQHAEQSATTGNDTVHRSNTSAQESQGGTPGVGDEHAFIRTWRACLRTSEQHRFPGRKWYGARFLLRALGEAAHKTGSRYVSFGTRSLAIASGMDHSTVSVLLHELSRTGWIDRLEQGRGEHADLYALTLPSDLIDRAADLRWDRGQIHALRPVFRELGHVAALVFEAVENGRAETVTQLVDATGISRRAVHEAVDLLTSWGLLDRTHGALLPRSDALLRVAEHLGVLEAVAAQLRLYAAQRGAWRAYLNRHESVEPGDPAESWWWPPDDAQASEWTLVDGLAT